MPTAPTIAAQHHGRAFAENRENPAIFREYRRSYTALRPLTYSESGQDWPMLGVQGHLPLRQGIRHARITEDLCQLQHLREPKKILVTH
jgi:hypothetical protein